MHASCAAVALTGLAWAWMRYALEPLDEFALSHHPLEPWAKALHLWSAPVLVFACGLIFKAHAWARLRSGFRVRRRTGWVLTLSLAPMALSGYLLQTATQEWTRTLFLVLHLGSSLAWIAGYAVHQFAPRARSAGGASGESA